MGIGTRTGSGTKRRMSFLVRFLVSYTMPATGSSRVVTSICVLFQRLTPPQQTSNSLVIGSTPEVLSRDIGCIPREVGVHHAAVRWGICTWAMGCI